MHHHEALEKVRKLLRLAQSSNPHEAALASSRAQEIMDRYKIESFALNYEESTAEAIRDWRDDPLDKARATWKDRLAMTIAKQNQCKIYALQGLVLIGRASDCGTVRYLYAWLVREIERLAATHCQGNGRTYFNNFRIGAQETVCARLIRQGQQTLEDVRKEAAAGNGADFGELFAAAVTPQSSALVLVEKGIALREKQMSDVEDWAKTNLKLRSSGGRRRCNYNSSAREAGRTAGNSIALRPTAGRLQ